MAQSAFYGPLLLLYPLLYLIQNVCWITLDSKLSRDLLCYIVGSSRGESSSDTVVAKDEKSLILQHCERFWQSKDSYKESSQQQINSGVFFSKSSFLDLFSLLYAKLYCFRLI